MLTYRELFRRDMLLVKERARSFTITAGQLRETTMNPDTRRLVQLTITENDDTSGQLDLLLAKKRSPDRKIWLETKGNLADIV